MLRGFFDEGRSAETNKRKRSGCFENEGEKMRKMILCMCRAQVKMRGKLDKCNQLDNNEVRKGGKKGENE
jgi:hypothetical protein